MTAINCFSCDDWLAYSALLDAAESAVQGLSVSCDTSLVSDVTILDVSEPNTVRNLLKNLCDREQQKVS